MKKIIRMKRIISVLIMVFIISTLLTPISFADNPIVQTFYTADPAPMVHDGVLYLYTSHDEDVTINNFFTMNDYKCYTTTDMVNWTDHGTVLHYSAFSWARGDAWAPQCIYRNGKYYMYVPLTRRAGGTAIGVAVSDSPFGPFTDPLGAPLVHTGTGDIDPTVFIDDDGQAYLYWGNPRLWYVKLNEDMISYSGQPTEVPLTVESFGPRSNTDRATSYEEGPWFYKRGNLYYMVFAGGPISEHIAYSTSPNPTGPWTYRGVIMPTQGSSFTNHAGVVDFKGNSYFFYHNGALPGGGGYKRSVCVEKFEYNADGTFPTINMTTEGAPQIEYLNPYVRTEAETIAFSSGIKTEPCSEGGINICSLDSGDYIKVKGVDFGVEGAGTFTASVASISNGGSIELRLDSRNGTLIGTLPVSYTGGENNWKTETTNISGATGVHDLYLVFRGGSDGNLFKTDYWQFGQKSDVRELAAINATIDKYKIDTVAGANTANINVTAIYTDGSSEDVTSQAVATPDQSGIVEISNGVVTGVGYGSTNITVSYEGKTDILNITVTDLYGEQAVKKLTVDIGDNVTLNVGGTATYKVTAEYYDGHTEDVTNKAAYNNPNTDIATIGNGTITARAKGTTIVTISFKGDMGETQTAQITITVTLGNPYIRNEAEAYNQQSGIQKETCSEGGQNIGYIENGDWIRFNNIDFGTGAASFEARVSSQGSGGNIEIRLDSLSGPLVGTCTVPVTGGWQSWTTVSCPVNGATGVHDLYLRFTGGSGYLFNINWWKFNPAEVPPGVSLNKTSVLLRAGDTDTLTATVYPIDEPDKTVIFSSGNPEVATVTGAVFDSETGTTSVTINARAKGTATITAATIDGKTATCTVTVIPSNELIVNGGFENGISPWVGNGSASVSLSNQDPYSGSNCLFATGRTATGDGPRQNLIFDVVPGHTYQVTAKVKYVGDSYPASKQFNFCITCDTERSDFWSSIRIMASANITKGAWGTISGTYQIAEDENISNPYIFVETVYASSPSATEDLMDFYVDDISLIDITEPPYVAVEGVTLDTDTLNLKEGESRQLIATVAPENATNKDVIWESDNIGVATVDDTGKVTAVAAGTATITVTTVDGEKTATCPVTVTPEAVEPTAAITAVESVEPGATFTAGISLDNVSSGVYAEDIVLSYDANVFEYVGVTGANDNIKILREDTSAGSVRLIAANTGGVSGASTPVLNVSFKVKAGVENTTGSIAVTSAKLGVPDGPVIGAHLSSWTITVGSSTPGVDKSELIVAINNAQTLYDNAEAGTEPGQYPQAAKDALNAAINAAKAVRDDSSATQAEVDSAVTALNNAVDIFKTAVVEEVTADINNDGTIDVADLAFVAYYYGKEWTDTEWQIAKAADMNGDGKIDIEDLAYVALKIED